MKYKLLVAFTLYSVYTNATNNTTYKKENLLIPIVVSNYQDTTLSYLMTLDFSYYKNKTVDTFLSVLPANYVSRSIHGMRNLKYARVLSVKYTGNIRVLIFVDNFTHMNPRSETLQWDLNLFKQENIGCIEIWNGTLFVSSTRCKQR